MRLLVDVFEIDEERREIIVATECSDSQVILGCVTKINFLSGILNMDYLSEDVEICVIRCNSLAAFIQLVKEFEKIFQAI